MPAGSFRNYMDGFFHMLGLIPVFVDGWIGQGENVLRAIERHQVAFVQLFLPMVLEFEKLEDRYDIKSMLSSLKGAAFAGMPLGKMLTEKVRDQWGVNLFTYTSAGDTGTAWEGRERDGRRRVYDDVRRATGRQEEGERDLHLVRGDEQPGAVYLIGPRGPIFLIGFEPLAPGGVG